MKPSTVVLNGIPCKYCWVCLYSDDLQALDEVALQSLQNPKGPTSWELTTSHRRLRDENKTICKESTDADSHESFLVSSGSLPDVQGFLRQWNILFEWHN